MDARLLEILVCPICKGPLTYDRAKQELVCQPDKLAYPIRDGIPVMLVDEARQTVEGTPLERVERAGPPSAEPLDPTRGA